MSYNLTDDKHISLGVSVCSQLLSDILNGFYERHPDANITVHTGYPLDCMQNHLDLFLDAYPQLTIPSSDMEPVSYTHLSFCNTVPYKSGASNRKNICNRRFQGLRPVLYCSVTSQLTRIIASISCFVSATASP